MLELLISPKAEEDLSEIYNYTFDEWGIAQADKYQDDLYSGMQAILSNSQLGKIYPHSIKQYRILHVNRHLIFYRIDVNKCIVVRILHDRMNVKSNF